jgi:hypothetical protein
MCFPQPLGQGAGRVVAVGACAKRLEGDADGGRRPTDIVNDSSLQIRRLDVAAEANPNVRNELRGRDLAAPRVVRPLLRPLDRHDVDVAREVERPSVAGAGSRSDD